MVLYCLTNTVVIDRYLKDRLPDREVSPEEEIEHIKGDCEHDRDENQKCSDPIETVFVEMLQTVHDQNRSKEASDEHRNTRTTSVGDLMDISDRRLELQRKRHGSISVGLLDR
jgi:hypothetical protein